MRLKIKKSMYALCALTLSVWMPLVALPHDSDAELEQTTSVRSSGDRVPRNAVEFDQLFQQIKSWGRWGPEDQLGAANLVTGEKRKQALALAKLGIVLGLGRRLSADASGDKTSPFEHIMMDWGFTTEPLVGFTADTYKITYHGSLTSHFDALCHVAYKGQTYNGYLVKDVYSEKGCTKLGVENLKNGIVTRGVLIDIPRLKQIPYLEPGTEVFAEDIEAWEKYAGVRISAGDAIFLRTGQWVRQEKIGATNEFAGAHPSVATWLKTRGVAFVGSDAGFELVPSPVEGVPFPVHVLAISALGIAIFDALDLEELSTSAAKLHRWEFLYSAGPMNVPGGTGSPMNPVAIF